MSWALLMAIGVLFAVGVFLVLQRNLTRVLVGLGMLAHGVNLMLLVASGTLGTAPILDGREGPFSDPLPQALILTAIVISFAMTAFLLALAVRAWAAAEDDSVEDDLEDRRIASTSGGMSR
ncbi:MAG: NADH-quinone oxidoreductase subunit K [Acidimicrobiia bacterium]|jgi:multicomponent Na+:H+ antiporter subunit C